MTDTLNTESAIAELDALISVLSALNTSNERNDGILKNNLLKLGAGSTKDVENFNQPNFDCPLNQKQLEDITFRDPLAYRVATTMPGLMASGGIEVTGLKPEALTKFNKAIRRSRILKAFERASVMANIYDKGAAIVLAVDDGKLWNEPVDEAKIKKVEVAFVQSGYKIMPLRLSGWTEAEYYQLSIDVTNETTKQLAQTGLTQVHRSRVLWFPGIWCPYDVEIRYNGSPSRVSMFWRAYSRYELGLSLAVNLMARISVVNFQRKGLLDMLAQSDKDAEKRLLAEMELVQQSFNNMGVIFSDLEKHKVEIVTRSLSEVSNLLGRLKQGAIAASGLTEVELFGETEGGGGLSNDDLRDRIIRANLVQTEQESYWREPMETFVRYQLIAQEKKEPEDWEVQFPSTLRLTPTEEMQALAQISTVGTQAFQMNSISANEFRALLAKKPVFAPYIDTEAQSPADKAEAEAKAQNDLQAQLDEANQTIADLQAQLDELSAIVPDENAPASEGEGGGDTIDPNSLDGMLGEG